jgi:hypothetical protein
VVEVYIAGGYNGSTSVYEYNLGDYEPWVSSWKVPVWVSEAKPISIRSGAKVGWETYSTEAAAKAAAERAKEKALQMAGMGYDFGYQVPGSIEKVADGWEVCVP